MCNNSSQLDLHFVPMNGCCYLRRICTTNDSKSTMSVIKRVLLLKTLFFFNKIVLKTNIFSIYFFQPSKRHFMSFSLSFNSYQRLIIIFAYHCQFLDAIHKHTAQKAHNGRSKGVGGDTVGANRVNRSFYCYCFTCILV